MMHMTVKITDNIEYMSSLINHFAVYNLFRAANDRGPKFNN